MSSYSVETDTVSCGAIQSFCQKTAGCVAPVSLFTHIVLINSFIVLPCVFILKPIGYNTEVPYVCRCRLMSLLSPVCSN